MRVFLCPVCGQSRIVSRTLNAECHQCKLKMVRCSTRYAEWVELSLDERQEIIKWYLAPKEGEREPARRDSRYYR